MKKNILIMATAFLMLPTVVHAATYDFSSYEVRKAYNEDKFEEIINMTEAERNMYKDKYLNDMYETDYKGISSAKQQVIKDLSASILSDESFTCEEGDSENLCKLRKFHDWIKQNFYYYNPVTQAKASALGLNLTEYDNPYYVLTKNKITKPVTYKNYGDTTATTVNKSHYIARCNGYTSVLIALARNAGMPARAVSGYYNTSYRTKTHEDWVKTEYNPDTGEEVIISKTNPAEDTLSHAWVLVYVDDRWVIIDANADSYNSYVEKPKCIFRDDDEEMGGTPANLSQSDCVNSERYAWGQWVISSKTYFVKDNDKKYFDVSTEDLSDSHIMFKFRPGTRNVAYLSNVDEMKKLKAFLNKTSGGKTNGKRINSSYTTANPKTWFTSPTKSLGDGYGRLYKLYWPEKKALWGSLNLNNFTALQNVSVPGNKLTYLFMENCPSLSTVAVANNKIKTITVTGSKKLTLLSAQGNPTTYVKYNFGPAPKTAIIQAGTGGTVSVRYKKDGTKYVHTMSAFAKSGYKFKGWYKGTTRISTKYSITKTNNFSFTYTAKFVKRK